MRYLPHPIYAASFKDFKYAIIPNFFQTEEVKRMADRMNLLERMGVLTKDTQCPKSQSIYGDPVQSEIQEMVRSRLSGLIKVPLLPTYTYSRIYAPKEVLYYHSDRPSCEISITGTLEYDTFDGDPWPIFIEAHSHQRLNKNTDGDVVKSYTADEHNKTEKLEVYGKRIYLNPGDVIVYRGCEVKHWRERFVGVRQSQVFMHYVDADGPYAECKYDFRSSLGSSVRDTEKVREFEEKLTKRRIKI